VVTGVKSMGKGATCPSSDVTCVTIGPSSSEYAEVGFCISYGSSCSGSLVPDVTWYVYPYNKKDKEQKKIVNEFEGSSSSFGSEGVEGNPIYLFIFDEGEKSTKGKYKDFDDLYYCVPTTSSSSCYGPYVIGIAVE